MLFAGVREQRLPQALRFRPGNRLAAIMREVSANALPPCITMRRFAIVASIAGS